MNSANKSKHKYGVLITLALVICTLVFPATAWAADQFASDVYNQAAGADQLAPGALPSWAGVVIVLGFIIVVAIMVHSVVVGRRKKHANYIKKV